MKQSLRPEFLNRIDEVVLFQPLSKSEIGKNREFQLRGFNQMLEKRNIILTATEDALKYLTNKGYDPTFGDKTIKRVLQQEVLNRLSKEILAGKINDGDRITLDYFEESGLVFDQLKITFIFFIYNLPFKFWEIRLEFFQADFSILTNYQSIRLKSNLKLKKNTIK